MKPAKVIIKNKQYKKLLSDLRKDETGGGMKANSIIFGKLPVYNNRNKLTVKLRTESFLPAILYINNGEFKFNGKDYRIRIDGFVANEGPVNFDMLVGSNTFNAEKLNGYVLPLFREVHRIVGEEAMCSMLTSAFASEGLDIGDIRQTAMEASQRNTPTINRIKYGDLDTDGVNEHLIDFVKSSKGVFVRNSKELIDGATLNDNETFVTADVRYMNYPLSLSELANYKFIHGACAIDPALMSSIGEIPEDIHPSTFFLDIFAYNVTTKTQQNPYLHIMGRRLNLMFMGKGCPVEPIPYTRLAYKEQVPDEDKAECNPTGFPYIQSCSSMNKSRLEYIAASKEEILPHIQPWLSECGIDKDQLKYVEELLTYENCMDEMVFQHKKLMETATVTKLKDRLGGLMEMQMEMMLHTYTEMTDSLLIDNEDAFLMFMVLMIDGGLYDIPEKEDKSWLAPEIAPA